MRLLDVGDGGDDRIDLVDRIVRVATDPEVDERGVPTGGDLATVFGRMFVTACSCETLATTSSIAAAKAGSSTVSVSL